MAGRDDIRFGQVLRQLLNDRFRNRRKDFAQAIHVSESALSQYVRGKATPSLAVLVAIARELDVTLDYLVLGTEPDPPAPNYGNLMTHVEDAVNRAQTKSVALREFVGRVGATLAEDIESTVEHVLAEYKAAVPGTLTPDEVRVLELNSKQIRIATADLDVDLLLLRDDQAGSRSPSDEEVHAETAPTPFTSVISKNVDKGRDYFYVVPEGPTWRGKARRLRDAVSESDGLSKAATDRRLRFYGSDRALVPGFVLYTIDTSGITPKGERLVDQIADYVVDSTVALVEPSSRQPQQFLLVDPRFHSRLAEEHATMAHPSHRLRLD